MMDFFSKLLFLPELAGENGKAVDELIIAESRFPTLILRQLGDMLDAGNGWRSVV